jgi:uncharacterized protein (TIGR03790 family)
MLPVSRRRIAALVLAVATLQAPALAGGGPLHVVVLFNADVPEAAAVARRYGEARLLPKGHLCGVSGLPASATTIDVATFKAKIQAPLDACIAALPHPDRVDYVVLVRGLPYVVTLPAYGVSLQAIVQVRHARKLADASELAGAAQPANESAAVPNPLYPLGNAPASDYTIDNPFKSWYSAASRVTRAKEQPAGFHAARLGAKDGWGWGGNLVIVSSLDGFDYKDAGDLVDRGVKADGTFPKAEILCMKGADEARGARDPECEYTTRMLKGAGLNGAWVPAFDGQLAGHTVAAYMTGAADARGAIAGNTFVPGAIACNLTSFGAAIPNFACSADGATCPASENQTSFARFVRAGATGAHGTVLEPKNNVFPNAGALLHYTFGYSMGESFLFNQRFLYWQSIYLGDPLTAPWAERPRITFEGANAHAVDAPIIARASHPAGVVSVELFLEGRSVARADGDTVSFAAPGKPGDKLDLLAVATAADAPVTRAGWPTPDQHPHPEIQGWAAGSFTLGPPSPAPPGADAGQDVAPSSTAPGPGCACLAGGAREPSPAWAIVAAPVALALRRQRRRS